MRRKKFADINQFGDGDAQTADRNRLLVNKAANSSSLERKPKSFSFSMKIQLTLHTFGFSALNPSLFAHHAYPTLPHNV